MNKLIMLNLKWTEAQENENISNCLLTWKINKRCLLNYWYDLSYSMLFFTGMHLHSSLWYPVLVSYAADSGIVLESFSSGTLSSRLSPSCSPFPSLFFICSASCSFFSSCPLSFSLVLSQYTLMVHQGILSFNGILWCGGLKRCMSFPYVF